MFKVYYFLIILMKFLLPICIVLSIRSSELMSNLSYFSLSILKPPEDISLLPSELDFKIPFSAKNFGKWILISFLMIISSISSGIFLFTVRFSKEFAAFLEQQMNFGISSMTFVIGGAYGFQQDLIPDSAMKIRLSEMTMNHQMIRIMFLEQLYRAFTIIRGESYHH